MWWSSPNAAMLLLGAGRVKAGNRLHSTAAEVHVRDRITLPDWAITEKEEEQTDQLLAAPAAWYDEQESAGRRADETVLLRSGHLESRGTMSTDFQAAGRKEWMGSTAERNPEYFP
ncbi:MAG: hypothetical protein FJ109_18205, partial [Deltaproteobacteria bacterium]|nr:hypothetical protein [Deltaproteobacteria bacterium]